uniref:Uncharacterized protein ycf23 n=1 Tax=Erythroglossum lusitanicum TaxID=2575615 RepID=A0A4D6WVC5_9FLOR|nr:hypothetical protein [Erythroglossum lusitanicum]
MKLFHEQLYNLFQLKRVIKIISGLNNSNINQIIKIVKSAELSRASYIDIVANTKIIKIIKSITYLPICVSSIDPLELYNCVIAGADLVEIGNFDCFYKKGLTLSSDQILQLAKETRELIKDRDICVTIPCIFKLSHQIQLAQDLEALGINIIQTEGLISKYNNKSNKEYDKIFCSTNIASETLSSTYTISRYVNIPVIAASGINYISSSIAMFYGASGIGIYSEIKYKKTIYDMTFYLNQIYFSLYYQKKIYNNNFLIHLKQKKSKKFLCMNRYLLKI